VYRVAKGLCGPPAYYSNSLGRFFTPDWASHAASVPFADFGDPQSLNLYGYVRNDPVALIDLDGHAPDMKCDSDCRKEQKERKKRRQAQEEFYRGLRNAYWDLQRTVGNAVQYARESLDSFNENIGFGERTNCGQNEDDCTNAVGMAGTAVLVAFVSDGASVGAAEAKGGVWVYRIVEDGKVVYIGITKNLQQRALQHGVPSLERIVKLGSRLEARAVEQALLEGYRAEGVVLRNKINSISTRNPIYKSAIQFGNAVLKSLRYSFKGTL